MTRAVRVLAGAALGVLLGTGFAGLAGAAPPEAEHARSGSAEPAARWTPPKPTGPIAVSYTLGGPPVVGQSLEIALHARAFGARNFAIEARAADAAALQILAQVPVADGDGERRFTVTVLPLAATAYLGVVVTAEIDGAPQARSVLIPIRTPEAAEAVRDSAAAAAATADDDAFADDEAVVSLPAEERP